MTKELKALEKIKQSIKPTQAVVKYDNGEQQSFYSHTLGELFPKEFDIIETALKEYEGAKNHIKALNKERVENSLKVKALEIIREKKLSMDLFDGCQSAEQYNKYMFDMPHFQLTPEEYDLLKEVLL